MSPPISLSVLLHKCWIERLENCCQHCGEINLDYLHHTNDHYLHNTDNECVDNNESELKYVALEEKNDLQTYKSGYNIDNNAGNSIKEMEERKWQPWERNILQHKMKGRAKREEESVVSLVYPKRLFNRIQKEAEVLLWQLPFPARFELVNDVIENEEDDEISDMLADLLDAYKLHEEQEEPVTNELVENLENSLS